MYMYTVRMGAEHIAEAKCSVGLHHQQAAGILESIRDFDDGPIYRIWDLCRYVSYIS